MNTPPLDWNNLPLVLTVKQIRELQLLPVGRNTLYNLLNSRGFPALRLGRRFIVPRDALREWLENHAQQG